MFFRRAVPHKDTFEERIQNLKQYGFETRRDSANSVLVTRRGYAARLENAGDGKVRIDKVGVLIGDEIGALVNGGYQMFFHTPSGREKPALADELKELHAFDEDLREGLGLTSLYNVSLGTTSEAHMYDRVEDRDRGHKKHPWEKTSA